MSFPRYPAYKDSGVEWLGEVPAHWEVIPLKRDIEFITSGARGWAENYSENGDLFIRIGNLTRNSIQLDFSDIQRVIVPDSAEVNRTQVRAGDVLFSITAYLGSVAVVPDGLGRAFVSQHVALVRPSKRYFLSAWIAYVALSYVGKTHLETTGYGGTKVQLSLADVTTLPVVTPPIKEQAALIEFIDRETTKIDALVAEQENLITLLKEKRQAVISHAVTKGLDPSVPMKDSGVEWLGEVPAHWSVKQLRHIAQIVRGASPRPAGDPRFFSADSFDGETVPWVTVSEITKDSEIYLREVSEYLTILGSEHSQFFPSGTLVFTNSGATLGVPKVLAIDCCANDGVLAFRKLSADVEIVFAYHFLSTTTDRLRTEMKQGGGQPNLNTDIVKNIGISVPPYNEQKTIVDFLAGELTKFNALTTEAQSAITLLQERRTALISAAVTGQIKVTAD